MPSFSIIRRSEVVPSFRIAKIASEYDFSTDTIRETFQGDLTPPEGWRIGLIVGPSGTGKTTIAKELYPDEYGAYLERKSAWQGGGRVRAR